MQLMNGSSVRNAASSASVQKPWWATLGIAIEGVDKSF
jgi:hypothetical protein